MANVSWGFNPIGGGQVVSGSQEAAAEEWDVRTFTSYVGAPTGSWISYIGTATGFSCGGTFQRFGYRGARFELERQTTTSDGWIPPSGLSAQGAAITAVFHTATGVTSPTSITVTTPGSSFSCSAAGGSTVVRSPFFSAATQIVNDNDSTYGGFSYRSFKTTGSPTTYTNRLMFFLQGDDVVGLFSASSQVFITYG